MGQLRLPSHEFLQIRRPELEHTRRAVQRYRDLEIGLIIVPTGTNLLKIDDAFARFVLIIISLGFVVVEDSILEDEIPFLPHFVKTWTLLFQQSFKEVVFGQHVTQD